MNAREILKRWRDAAGDWAHWIKPSLLAEEGEGIAAITPVDLGWTPPATGAAIIVELPALESIAFGVAVARLGWCVVPMFNTTHAMGELLPTTAIIEALRGAAAALPVEASGPPALLLDSNRQKRILEGIPGAFNNCWYVFESDLPSVETLGSHGIKRILVVARELPLLDLRDALTAHLSQLECVLVDPVTGKETLMPKSRGAVARGLARFSHRLFRNSDGTFGRPISSG